MIFTHRYLCACCRELGSYIYTELTLTDRLLFTCAYLNNNGNLMLSVSTWSCRESVGMLQTSAYLKSLHCILKRCNGYRVWLLAWINGCPDMTDSSSVPLMKMNYLLYLNMKFMFHQMSGLHVMFSLGFAVFTAMIMKIMVFCVVTP